MFTVIVSVTLRTKQPTGRPVAPTLEPESGFTLLEVMVVVVIIAVSAALAIPAATEQFRERHSQRLTQDIMAAYRNGRTDAMARGGAVLIRYDAGTITVLQGIQGTAAGGAACQELPVAQCNRPVLADWNDGAAGNRLLTEVRPTNYQGSGATLQVVATVPSAGSPAQLDVCFTPLGRAFIRQGQANLFAPMTVPVTLDVHRVDSSDAPIGMRRRVTVLPSGAARVGAAQ